MPDTGSYLGLDPANMVAGFAGGLVHALVFKQGHPWSVVASIVTGTLTANFLTGAAVHYLPDWVGGGGAAFLVGLSAMAICQGAVTAIQRGIKSKVKPLENSDGQHHR